MKTDYFQGLKWKSNLYTALFWRLMLMMTLFTLCRIGFYLFNIRFFADMQWGRFIRIAWGGLRFDLAGLLYVNSLFLLLSIVPLKSRYKSGYQTVLKYIFFVTNGAALAMNVADCVYYPFTLRRTTMTVLGQFRNETNFGPLLISFLIDYWYALVFWIGLMAGMILVYNRIRVAGPQLKSKIAFYGSGAILFPIIIYLFIGGVRGGFAHSTRPITLSNAAEYATTPKDINLVLNTPFAFIRTAKAAQVERVDYFASEAELEKEFTPLHTPKRDSIKPAKDNVVIIILESFSKEFVGYYNRDLSGQGARGYTPFLDSLIGVSRAYHYSFANGRKSIDAMPSVICSIPSIEVPYVLSHYSGNKVNSLASLLKREGYYTSFFHGAPNGSMGFQAFANLSEFDDYFGKTEYDNDDDYDGIWGIWDEKFLNFYADKLNTFRQPFYSTVFTVSSHPPHNLPDEYKQTFKGGPLDIHKTIEYTDYSLKQFFRKISKMPWFDNTLFVITADHASGSNYEPLYNTAWGYYSIPVFFYKHGMKPSYSDEIIQQIDIMPTVLNYLHYDKPYVAFGRDVFDSTSVPFAFNYSDNYQVFSGNYLLQFDGKKSVGLYDFKTDRLLQHNLVNEQPTLAAPLERKLKAFIQQYNNRMVDDNLTIEGPLSPAAKK